MTDRYYVFRKLMDFINDFCEITAATMFNYSGEIEIAGVDEDGSSVTIRVEIKEPGNEKK